MIKAFAAFQTFVRFLPGVDPFVTTEDEFVTKAFSTDQASALLLTFMDELVIPEPCAATKSFPALQTLVQFWLLVRREIHGWIVTFQVGEYFLF